MALVFAHRGASAELPEHTLAAYRQALAAGADGIECDVRLTRDGHLVCVHDRRLDRVSDGTGPVATRTLSELQELDFGSWHASGETAPVLTLEELIKEVKATDRPVRMLIETKRPHRHRRTTVEHRLRELLEQHGLSEGVGPVQVTIMSFSPLAIRRARTLLPALPTVQLMSLVGMPLRGAEIAGPWLELVRRRPALIRRMKDQGMPVYVWTVNELSDVDLLVELGVDGLITDRPAEVLAHLGR